MCVTTETIGTAGTTLFADLAEAGFVVERIGELRWRPYRDAVPILLHWLPRVEDWRLRWAIVSALGVSWAKPLAAPALITEFRQAPHDPYGYKWAVGYALSEVADDSVFDDLVPLVCDKGHGHARQMIVDAFGALRHPRAVDVLMTLLDEEDTEIVEHALLALGRRKATRARPRIEPFLDHPDRYVRGAAARALTKIDGPRRRAEAG